MILQNASGDSDPTLGVELIPVAFVPIVVSSDVPHHSCFFVQAFL